MCALSHLDKLEAEAIYIIREVAAECEKPVMLYSIGKDSSVMLHLARKAFYPEKPPFPFLHVNTTWKFKEMIRFRDETMKKYGLQLIEYINQEGVKQGVNPFDYGAAYTDIMKTQALKQALHKYGFTAAFGGGTNPLPCFFHGGIRQPHNVKAGKAIGNIGLRRDEISPDSVDAHGTNAANHVFPPLLCTVSILQETAEKYNPPI